MRLGRKISEGFVVDHEADRVAAEQGAPEPVVEILDWTQTEPVDQPARSGSREG